MDQATHTVSHGGLPDLLAHADTDPGDRGSGAGKVQDRHCVRPCATLAEDDLELCIPPDPGNAGHYS